MKKYISDCQDIVDEIGFITSYDKHDIVLNAFDEDKEDVGEYVSLIFNAMESLNDFVEAYSAEHGRDKDWDIDDILTEALSWNFEHDGEDALYIEELLKKAYEAYKKGKMKFRSFDEDSQRDFWHYVMDKMYKYYEDIKEYYNNKSDKHWIEDIVDDYTRETGKHILGGDALSMVNNYLFYNSDEFEDNEEEEEDIEESHARHGRMLREDRNKNWNTVTLNQVHSRDLENMIVDFGMRKKFLKDIIDYAVHSDLYDDEMENWSRDDVLNHFYESDPRGYAKAVHDLAKRYWNNGELPKDEVRDWCLEQGFVLGESRRPHGRMLREGAYNEGKRVWKITAIADNDYEDDVVRYFRTEKAADEAYEDMSKDNTYKFVEEPEEYVIQYNDDIEAEPNYWMDGTVSWIEGDYDFGDYTVEVDGGLPTIAMKFNYNNDDADEDNEIFLQGIDAEIAVNEICDIYSNGDKTPKEAVELWSRQYA